MKIYKVVGQSFDAYDGGVITDVSHIFVTKQAAEEYMQKELANVVSYVEDIANEIGESSIEIEDRKYINFPWLHTARVTFRPKATDIPNEKGEPVYHYDEKTTELVLWFSGLGDYKCEKMTSTHRTDIELLSLRLVEYDTDNLK